MHLLVVGKYKNPHLEALEKDYLKRLTNYKLEISEIKASAESPQKEWQSLKKKLLEIRPQKVIGLTEEGDHITTLDLSQRIQSWPTNTCLIIGGAEGLASGLKQECHELISLSPLTFPHKLARLILVEQIYRAQSVQQGHPYHNA